MEDKKYRNVKIHCRYTEEYGGALHSICNLKHSMPEEIPIVFDNGLSFYHKRVSRIIFKKKTYFFRRYNLHKVYLTYYNLLIAQDSH